MNFDDLMKKIDKIQRELITKPLLKDLGGSGKDSIKNHTRLGKGIDKTGGKLTKLKDLSEGYKKSRKGLKKLGILSSKTKPAKSNLTKTGRMLDNLEYKVLDNEVKIQPNSKDSQKALDQENAGRKFFTLSKGEIIKLKDILSAHIEKVIKKHGL